MGIQTIAFYLPQFHPIPENDAAWGTGFTEWTNVTRATPLFRGHQQPFLPADLGFYDLRVPEVREQQAALARQAGITAFAYWHYWFGNGRRVLERPLAEVLKSGRPDFPFCLAWANESWRGRWHGLDDDSVLIEQTYPGHQDQTQFFYDCLPYFRDSRYATFQGRTLFITYSPSTIPSAAEYIKRWRELGVREGIDFYLIGMGDRACLDLGCDGFIPGGGPPRTAPHNSFTEVLFRTIGPGRAIGWPGLPRIGRYTTYVRKTLNDALEQGEHPLVIPNWDNTPRCGRRGELLLNSTPELFGQLLQKAVDRVRGTGEERLIFIKSWNEWAEGNVMEPSMRWQKAYIQTCRRVLDRDLATSAESGGRPRPQPASGRA